MRTCARLHLLTYNTQSGAKLLQHTSSWVNRCIHVCSTLHYITCSAQTRVGTPVSSQWKAQALYSTCHSGSHVQQAHAALPTSMCHKSLHIAPSRSKIPKIGLNDDAETPQGQFGFSRPIAEQHMQAQIAGRLLREHNVASDSTPYKALRSDQIIVTPHPSAAASAQDSQHNPSSFTLCTAHAEHQQPVQG
jgi:hypothetical protein